MSKAPYSPRQQVETQRLEPVVHTPTSSSGAAPRADVAGLRKPARRAQAVGDPRTPSGQRLRPGEIIADRYRIEQAIEPPGSFARVYRATQLSTGRPVALKVLLTRYLSNPDVLRRMKAQGEALCRIQHPNVVTVYDIGFDAEGRMWIAMEHLNGPTLRWLLKARKRLALDEALYVVSKMGAALHSAHERGVIHGDIKPENVFLVDDGFVKVSDFRTAEFLTTSDDELTCTVHYVAPELIYKEYEPSVRSDVYSFALVVDELIRGHNFLIEGEEKPVPDELIVWRQANVRPTLLSGVPSRFAQTVLSALDKDPSKRPPSIQAFTEQLWRAAQEDQREKPTISRPIVTTVRGARKSPSILAGVVAGAVLGAGIHWALRSSVETPSSTQAGVRSNAGAERVAGGQGAAPEAQPGDPQPEALPATATEPHGSHPAPFRGSSQGNVESSQPPLEREAPIIELPPPPAVSARAAAEKPPADQRPTRSTSRGQKPSARSAQSYPPEIAPEVPF